MDGLVDLALKSTNDLAPGLLIQLHRAAADTSDRARLRALAGRDDLPYEVRRQLDEASVRPSAAAVARWAAKAKLTSDELDALIDSDGRASVLAAIASRQKLSASTVSKLAAADEFVVAWELSDRPRDCDAEASRQIVATLIAGYVAGRKSPPPQDIARRLSLSRWSEHVLARDDVPLGVLAYQSTAKLTVEQLTRLVDALCADELGAREAVAVATQLNYDIMAHGDASLAAAHRIVAKALPESIMAQLRITAATYTLTSGVDPVEAAPHLDAAHAAELTAIVQRCHRYYGSTVLDMVRQLACNPRLTEESLGFLLETLGRWSDARTVSALCAAGFEERAVTFVTEHLVSYRLRIVADPELPLTVRVAALRSDTAAAAEHSWNVDYATAVVMAAVGGEVILEVPTQLVLMAASSKAPDLAAEVLTAVFEATSRPEAVWPALMTLSSDLDGTLAELIDAVEWLS